MVEITRERQTSAIHENFHGANKAKFEKELMYKQRGILQGKAEKHDFISDRWRAAKEQLIAEAKGKCAYCEAPLTTVSFGDVEHYRPKSKYWWLAYCYENYLVSCQLCNQKFKGDKFPIKNSKMKGPSIRKDTPDTFIEKNAGKLAPDPLNREEISGFAKLHNMERPYLLNPYYDDPNKYFAWRADDNLREVELIPSNAKSRDFSDIAISNYGLNRQELKENRWMVYSFFIILKDTLNERGLSQEIRIRIENQIKIMQEQDAPFAGMVRYFSSPRSEH